MMIPKAENTYNTDGNSADFHRCAEGWRLYNIAFAAMSEAYPDDFEARWNEYTAHVRDCPDCIAMTGRFEEANQEYVERNRRLIRMFGTLYPAIQFLMGTGVVIIGIGLILFRVPNPGKTACTRTEPTRPQEVSFQPRPKPWFPLLGGLLNGLAPCSLVFSVALQAAATTDPLRAGLLMLVFGLGTLPAMLGLSLLSAFIGERMRGLFARLAALTVFALGAWTFYQGWVFFDIMRGLGNW